MDNERVSGYQKLRLQSEALLKTLEAERDPKNVEKRLAAEAAQAAFLDATSTVESAVAKALASRNQPVNLLEAYDVGGDPDTASDGDAITKRVRARAAGATTTKASRINDGRADPVRKRMNMDYGRLGLDKED